MIVIFGVLKGEFQFLNNVCGAEEFLLIILWQKMNLKKFFIITIFKRQKQTFDEKVSQYNIYLKRIKMFLFVKKKFLQTKTLNKAELVKILNMFKYLFVTAKMSNN